MGLPPTKLHNKRFKNMSIF